MKAQVPNSTIAVLLVLAIMVSAIGTWTVLQKVKDMNVNAEVGAGSVTGLAANTNAADATAPSITGSMVDETVPDDSDSNITNAPAER
ncbi:MAG: hypothetical protein Q7R76_05560 [Candidatus Woesearchaeota archaeon]|nr:hypothetical protein [Candidatus Woesearchaeota archaeon]